MAAVAHPPPLLVAPALLSPPHLDPAVGANCNRASDEKVWMQLGFSPQRLAGAVEKQVIHSEDTGLSGMAYWRFSPQMIVSTVAAPVYLTVMPEQNNLT